MTVLYLVRHAKSVNNLSGHCGGRRDYPLADEGRAQLPALAERFKTIHIDRLYSSPLTRAFETAKAVNSSKMLDITARNDLMEMCFGIWEGLKFDDIKRDFSEGFEKLCSDPTDFYVKGAETSREIYGRAKKAFDSIARENAGKSVCVVSHGDLLKFYLMYVLGLPFSEFSKVPLMPNTSIVKIEYDENFVPHMAEFDSNSHLSSGMKKEDIAW